MLTLREKKYIKAITRQLDVYAQLKKYANLPITSKYYRAKLDRLNKRVCQLA